MVSGHLKKKVETGSGLKQGLVSKIFLKGVTFDKVYNESVHENMKNYKNYFPHRVQKKINLLF